MADDVDVNDLLGGEPAEVHPVLTAEQVRAARAEARERVEAARVKAAMRALIDEETLRLEREEGLTTGSKSNDEMVRITLDLAPFQKNLTLNFRPFHHGGTYVVPRHVANTLREMQANGWRHQHEIEGKSRTEAYQQAEEATISGVSGVKSQFSHLRDARQVAA